MSNFRDALLWDIRTGKILAQFKTKLTPDYHCSSNPIRVIASDWEKNIVYVWDSASETPLSSFSLKGKLRYDLLSPDGSLVVTKSEKEDRSVRVWDVMTGQELTQLLHEDTVLFGVIFSPDSHHVATASKDQTVRLWDARTGEEMVRLRHESQIVAFTFSPDGRRVATATVDRVGRVWDARTGEELNRLQYHGEVKEVAFSPNGHRLVMWSKDQEAQIWDIQRQQLTLLGPQQGVKDVIFSPDSTQLAIGSWDGKVRVWDTGTGEEFIRILPQRPGPSLSLAFSHDGKRLVSTVAGGRQGLIFRQWLLQRDELIAEACARLTRNMTPEEWRLYLSATDYSPTCPGLPDYSSKSQ
jgi:WD40 repeat protein